MLSVRTVYVLSSSLQLVSLRTRSSLRRERLAFEGPRQALRSAVSPLSHGAPLFKWLDCETKAQFYRSQFPRQLKQWDSCLLMPQFSSYW
jgi:hypothetical protein